MYKKEKKICDFLGLHVDDAGWVLAYYGFPNPEKPSGWQVVCHIDKLKMYLCRKLHPKHWETHKDAEGSKYPY